MDPFALLGAPRRFDLDLSVLEKTHRELSRALHPDKFAQASASERRAALEKAANVNEAWRIVRDPIRRAEALFTVAGIKVGETNEPKASPAFLMDVLEEREALAEARTAKNMAKVRSLGEKMEGRSKEAERKLARGIETAFAGREETPDRATLETVLPVLGELRFYKRFLDEVSAIEEEEAS
ncbi:Chaperone protein HscB [Labilithrix luteola]|uniref:Co-chaperone protein HscB homolog n=1 Tax=Labilithrix luteola TaxID=1391654 RepID=A0A0K1Q1E2_9BACT|nr:Fe-S protein assembly co-chaperone HscB [Labilithrix luteola]AKU99209.1 Chaperone protein HscB [Labilithrix luteola]